jgi:hypothetical protein
MRERGAGHARGGHRGRGSAERGSNGRTRAQGMNLADARGEKGREERERSAVGRLFRPLSLLAALPTLCHATALPRAFSESLLGDVSHKSHLRFHSYLIRLSLFSSALQPTLQRCTKSPRNEPRDSLGCVLAWVRARPLSPALPPAPAPTPTYWPGLHLPLSNRPDQALIPVCSTSPMLAKRTERARRPAPRTQAHKPYRRRARARALPARVHRVQALLDLRARRGQCARSPAPARARPDAGVRGRRARRGLSERASPRRRPKRKRRRKLAGAIQAVVSLTSDDAKQPRIHGERITIKDFVVLDVSGPSEHEAPVIKSR